MHQIKGEVIEDPEVESKYIDYINIEDADTKPFTRVVENQFLQCVMCPSENDIEVINESDLKHSDIDVKDENEPLSELVPVLKNEDQVSLYEALSQRDNIGKWIDSDSRCLTKETKLGNDLSIQLNCASSSENRNVIIKMEKTLPLCDKFCLSCPICIKNFNSQKDLVEHMLLHNSDSVDNEIFFCDICGLSFITKKNMTKHLMSHKSNKSELFSCELCSKSFCQKIYLERHIRSHTGERPYSCNLCCKSFSHSGHLNRHMQIHTGIRAFVCNICTKRFSQSIHLSRHMHIHTNTNSRSQFSCNVCGKSYSRKHGLIRHVMCIHTGEGFLYCNFCNKRFMAKKNLRLHMYNHTGECLFSCNVCSKSFVRKYDLKIHCRVHTNERPFTCKLCSKTFNHRCNLNKHMREHN